jgi:hypothetical protein
VPSVSKVVGISVGEYVVVSMPLSRPLVVVSGPKVVPMSNRGLPGLEVGPVVVSLPVLPKASVVVSSPALLVVGYPRKLYVVVSIPSLVVVSNCMVVCLSVGKRVVGSSVAVAIVPVVVVSWTVGEGVSVWPGNVVLGVLSNRPVVVSNIVVGCSDSGLSVPGENWVLPSGCIVVENRARSVVPG